MKTKHLKKMKKLFYKSGILLIQAFFLLSLTLSAEEVSKEIHKEFMAEKGTNLDIINKYGDVIVESWANNQIVIDVKITVELPDKAKAEKLLSYIDVLFTEGENIVNAETVIGNSFPFTGWVGASKRFSIDYTVKMPADANLNIDNRYGNTELGELNGLVNIVEKYGDINILKLTRGNEKPLSTVNISYGKVSIDECNWLDITSRYCNMFEIQTSKALLIDTRYSKFDITDVSSIVMDAKYDDLNIENINNIVATSGYTTFSITKLTKKLDIQAKYGKLSVGEIPSGFEAINVGADYCSVELGIDESASYHLDANARYGDIKYNEDNFKVENRIIDNTSKTVTGVSGSNANTLSKVTVRTSYGSVSLY
jgi:hypothetical protein